jgi:hypothetical protein
LEKSSTDLNFEIHVAAAATDCCSCVATTAAVNDQYEQGNRRYGDTYMSSYDTKNSGDRENNALGSILEGERKSRRSENNDSTKSGFVLDIVECDISCKEITMGWQIRLGTNFTFL